jgi:hypothetical protein
MVPSASRGKCCYSMSLYPTNNSLKRCLRFNIGAEHVMGQYMSVCLRRLSSDMVVFPATGGLTKHSLWKV